MRAMSAMANMNQTQVGGGTASTYGPDANESQSQAPSVQSTPIWKDYLNMSAVGGRNPAINNDDYDMFVYIDYENFYFRATEFLHGDQAHGQQCDTVTCHQARYETIVSFALRLM